MDAKTANAVPEEKDKLEANEELDPEVLLLGEGDSERIAKTLEMPELHAEIDRAIWQVQRSMQGEKELEEEKQELMKTAKRDAESLKEDAKDKADEVVNGTKKKD